MSEPAVSVLLPVRNAGPHLDACHESLVRQSLCGLEVVAVDDGSSDGSGDRLEAWAAQKPWVRVLHQPPEGLVAALNVGLAACRGLSPGPQRPRRGITGHSNSFTGVVAIVSMPAAAYASTCSALVSWTGVAPAATARA